MTRAISEKAQAVIDEHTPMFLAGIDVDSGFGAYDQQIYVGDIIAPLNSQKYYYVTRLAKYLNGVYWEGVDVETGDRNVGPIGNAIIER